MINKTDLAPYVGVDVALLEQDAARARGTKPYVMADLRSGLGVDRIASFIETHGGL